MIVDSTLGKFLSGSRCALGTVVRVQTFALPTGRFRAVTRVTVQIDQPILGSWPTSYDVDMIGGTIGDVTVEVEDQPVPKVGKRVLIRADAQARERSHAMLLDPGGKAGSPKAWAEVGREMEALGKRKGVAPDWAHKLLARRARDFVHPPGDPVWSGTYPTTVTLEIWDNTSDLGAEDAFGAVAQAIDTWNAAGANFSIRRVVRSGGLAALTTDRRMIVRWSPTGPAGVLATTTWSFNNTTNQFIDADIQFWDNQAWSTNPGATQLDIQSVAAHELGHFLGVPHSTGATDVMQAAIGAGVQRRVLSANDIAAIQGLYGSRPVGDFIVYRWWNGRDHFYTTHVYSELAPDVGYTYEGAPFRLFAAGTANTTRFFRWYHPTSGDHFYCTDPNGELAPVAGYLYEGAAGNIATSQIAGTIPLFRWYHPTSGDHFYTTDPSGELAPVTGYQAEGTAGFVRPP